MKRWAFIRLTDYDDGTEIAMNVNKIKVFYEDKNGGVYVDLADTFYHVKESIDEIKFLIGRAEV